MAEELRIKNGDKQEMYETLLPQIASLVGNETDLIANMANVAAALKQTFGFFWVGFYRVIEVDEETSVFSRPYRLYTNQIRKRGMRHGLEGDPYDHRTGCRRFPGTYRL